WSRPDGKRYGLLRSVAVPFARTTSTPTRSCRRASCTCRATPTTAPACSDLRYRWAGAEGKEFPLNRSVGRDGQIAPAGQTSACASSRENAVRAIQGHVFRAVIALSSGDIFAQNGLTNDLLRVPLQAATVVIMIAQAGAEPEGEARVDLAAQFVIAADGSR